jgi:hypothetical protein
VTAPSIRNTGASPVRTSQYSTSPHRSTCHPNASR